MEEGKSFTDLLGGVLSKLENRRTAQYEDHTLIVDGTNMFLSVFAAVPTLNKNGDHVGGVLGFLKSLAYNIRLTYATRCVVVFDGAGGSAKRRKLFPDYKSGRRNKQRLNRFKEFNRPEEEAQSIQKQYTRIIQYLETLPLHIVVIDNIEADDVISYIATNFIGENRATIVSTDKDFLQLVSDNIHVRSITKKKLYTPKEVYEEFQIPSHNFLTYRILDGDKSDSIPGVRGVGLKTLIKAIPEVTGSVVLSYEDLVNISKKKLEEGSKLKAYQTITDNEEQLYLNYQLMQLHDVKISLDAKNRIRSILNSYPNKCDLVKFQKFFLQDLFQFEIKKFDDWYNSSFSLLNQLIKTD
jgi:DNA polymerase-1